MKFFVLMITRRKSSSGRVFNYQRTISDKLPTRYLISVILLQFLLSFDSRQNTLTALAVGRQRSTNSPALREPSRCFVDKFRLHSAISGIFRPNPQVRLQLILSNMEFSQNILSKNLTNIKYNTQQYRYYFFSSMVVDKDNTTNKIR